MVFPPNKCATEPVQDPASELSSEKQAERPIQQPATEPGVLHVPETPLTEPKQDNVGSSNPENEWITDEDVSIADQVRKSRISPRGAHWTKTSRQPINPPLGASKKIFEARHRYLNVRDAALKRLNFGVDANWPDESQILDQIWRQQGHPQTTLLEWRIDKQKKLDISGSGKSVKQCVVTIEVEDMRTEDEFSNTEGVTGLNIISAPLQEVLRQVITFDPSVSLYQDPISLQTPFSVLFHNMPALEEYSVTAEADEPGTKDLRVLLYICKKVFARLFQSIRVSLAAGDVFDEALTALYRPGALLLATDVYKQPHVFMCLSARSEHVQYTDGDDRHEFIVRTWYLQWNHLYQRLERQLAHFSLGDYDGTRKIKELPIYPLDYYGTDTAQRDLKAQMIERNRRWTRLVSQKPSCWKHEGLAVVQGSDVGQIKVSHDVRSPKSHFMVTHSSSTTVELS